MSDERPESLAAQAASWVPPWERASRPPDQDFAAKARAGEGDGESGLLDDDDDFDPAFEGANPAPGDGVPAELPPFPEETGGPPTVDAPREVPGEEERDPTDVGVGPELPLPGAVEEAAENEIGSAPMVDAPLDGDDAGDVFDVAADDDVEDDAEVDLPFEEQVPGPEEDDDPDGTDADPPAEQAPAPEEDEPASRIAGSAESVSAAADAAGRGAADVEAAVAAGALASQPGSRARGGSGIPAQQRGSKGDAAASAEPSTRTGEGATPDRAAPMDDAELRAALEAILLVVDEPVAELQLAQIVEQPAERIARMLEDVSARYTAAGHGFDLRRAAGGWRLYTRPEYAAYVERFVLDGQSVRLTQAALETLAVVAYKQPVTRSRISAIRGVNCDGVMRTLNTRGLIEECGIEGETGAFLYRTTALFLEKLGLNSVDQLPPLAPFLPDDVEEVLDASG
jgi:segregation and condensation protein B